MLLNAKRCAVFFVALGLLLESEKNGVAIDLSVRFGIMAVR